MLVTSLVVLPAGGLADNGWWGCFRGLITPGAR